MENEKPRSDERGVNGQNGPLGPEFTWALALTRLEPAVGLVDHVDPALAADHPAIAVAVFRRFQRIPNFHGLIPSRPRSGAKNVGGTYREAHGVSTGPVGGTWPCLLGHLAGVKAVEADVARL